MRASILLWSMKICGQFCLMQTFLLTLIISFYMVLSMVTYFLLLLSLWMLYYSIVFSTSVVVIWVWTLFTMMLFISVYNTHYLKKSFKQCSLFLPNPGAICMPPWATEQKTGRTYIQSINHNCNGVGYNFFQDISAGPAKILD